MCNCIKEVEKKILAVLQTKYPNKTYSEVTTFNGLGFQNKTWAFETGQILLLHEMRFESTFTKVNGETSQPRKETVNINGSYCIFCGEKSVKDEQK